MIFRRPPHFRPGPPAHIKWPVPKTSTMMPKSFCGNFLTDQKMNKYAFSFDIHPILDQSTDYHRTFCLKLLNITWKGLFSTFYVAKKLPQKNWYIGHYVNFLPESSLLTPFIAMLRTKW